MEKIIIYSLVHMPQNLVSQEVVNFLSAFKVLATSDL